MPFPSSPPHYIQRHLEAAASVKPSGADSLKRLASQAGTDFQCGVVMAALILYHFFNRLEYRTDTRFADMAAGSQGKAAS